MRLLSYQNLLEAGIMENITQLKRQIKLFEFPRPIALNDSRRATEVDAWVAKRPNWVKPIPIETPPGRPPAHRRRPFQDRVWTLQNENSPRRARPQGRSVNHGDKNKNPARWRRDRVQGFVFA